MKGSDREGAKRREEAALRCGRSTKSTKLFAAAAFFVVFALRVLRKAFATS